MNCTPTKRETVAVVDTGGSVEDLLLTVRSLQRAHPELLIVAVTNDGTEDGPIKSAGALTRRGSMASAVNETWRERRCHVLVVREPTTFPARALDRARAIVEENLSIGTVSFLRRGTGFLALAGTDDPAFADEDAVTATLRSSATPLPVPIPFAEGPAVLLSAYALSALGDLADAGESPEAVLGGFSVRARRKGFLDVVDPSTFLSPHGGGEPSMSITAACPEARELHDLLTAPSSPISTFRRATRATVAGVTVLIDGSCLGPLEMGTQVQTVALVRALARRSDVARVAVALPDDLPPYARSMVSVSKVDARPAPTGDLSTFGTLDVAHQPFQPEGPVDIAGCGDVAARYVVTLLDLIAYRGRSYQTSAGDWTRYRQRVFRAASLVDAVIAPTHDVARQIRIERLPVDDDRLFVVPIGTDHLQGDEAGVMPPALAAALPAERPFLLVLGADYTHKNRDLAIRTLQELRRRGSELSLVMAGMNVYGSSQREESDVRAPGDPVHVLGDVTSEERNWLLRHASVVLYPTSAEGVGLVPFEAAGFSTPTVLVPFGPLGELLGALPVTSADWSPQALATTAETLLHDSDAAADQVRATLAIGAQYTWDACAAALVEVYRTVLGRPALEARTYLSARDGELDAIRAERDRLHTANERVRHSAASRASLGLEALRGKFRR